MNRWKSGCAERHKPGVRKAAVSIQSPCLLTNSVRIVERCRALVSEGGGEVGGVGRAGVGQDIKPQISSV